MHSPAERPTNARTVLLGFVLSLTAIAYLDRVCISAAKPAIKTALQLTDSQMGYVFSAYTLSYALMEVPAGWLADRFGARLMLTRIVIWWSAMTALSGAARGFGSLYAIRLLFGAGEAGAFPSIARVFARWFPASARGRAFGITVMAGTLGGALTQPLVVAMLGLMSWRHAFSIFGGIGVLWAIAWYAWFRDDPRDHRSVNAAEVALIGTASVERHGPPPWRALFRSRSMPAMCVM